MFFEITRSQLPRMSTVNNHKREIGPSIYVLCKCCVLVGGLGVAGNWAGSGGLGNVKFSFFGAGTDSLYPAMGGFSSLLIFELRTDRSPMPERGTVRNQRLFGVHPRSRVDSFGVNQQPLRTFVPSERPSDSRCRRHLGGAGGSMSFGHQP